MNDTPELPFDSTDEAASETAPTAHAVKPVRKRRTTKAEPSASAVAVSEAAGEPVASTAAPVAADERDAGETTMPAAADEPASAAALAAVEAVSSEHDDAPSASDGPVPGDNAAAATADLIVDHRAIDTDIRQDARPFSPPVELPAATAPADASTPTEPRE